MTFDITVQEDGSLYGNGSDNVGQVCIVPKMDMILYSLKHSVHRQRHAQGSKLDFQKDYTEQNIHWIYADV